MIDKEKFGKRLSVLRKKAGLSQLNLSEKFNVSTQAVSKWETGIALPDVDILLEISYLFDIPLNILLEGDDSFVNSAAMSRVKLPQQIASLLTSKGDEKLLSSLYPYFAEQELLRLAKHISGETFEIKLDVKMRDTKAEYEKKAFIPINHMSDQVLRELAPVISGMATELVGGIDRGIKRISGLMICPSCGEQIELHNSDKQLYFICVNGHRYDVDEGIVYFGSRELKGELWSLSLRNFEHYMEWKNAAVNPNNIRGEATAPEAIWREIAKRRPRTILDIATGMAFGATEYLKRIDWQCTVILTDLSHRILKWDKQYIEGSINNPYVDVVYLACDCANIPLASNSIECVTSLSGFESMQNKKMDGFSEGFRLLKKNGCAIYSMATVDDCECDNTKKWIDLLYNALDEQEKSLVRIADIRQWSEVCGDVGYVETEFVKLYDELPAPDTDVFPYENNILQWMSEYVYVSKK